ncbi:MAG: ATP synthase subunit I [Bacilli bacterium]|nr:ATP synthase subunit I [Bacilli bacterium]
MKNWFRQLSISYQTALISSIVVLVGFLATLFGYFTKYPDIPNGVLLGGLIGILSYLLMGLVEKYDERKGKPVLTVVMTVVRFILIALVIVLSAYLWFKKDYHIFNLFSELIAYAASLITFIVLYLVEKNSV